MTKCCAQVCCLMLLCAGVFLRAAEPPVPLIVEPQGEGEFDFNPQTGEATAAQGVVVRYGNAVLTADKATVNQFTGEALAQGHVRIEREGQIWTGERIVYNFKTRELSTDEFRTGMPPFFLSGRALDVTLTNRLYVVTNALMTTGDYKDPGYSIRAKRITIVPGEYIEARHATYWLGKVPIFYLPFINRSLKHHPNFWTLTPGYRNLFGPYLLTAYHWHGLDDQLAVAMNMDYRLKRGPGVGPDIHWNSPVVGEGTLRYYYAHDEDPGLSPILQPIPENRHRVWFSHRATLRTNLTAKVMVRYQSDGQVVRDFFESEYRENVQPNSFLEVNQDWSNWNLNLFVQPQVNDFQETVERLPDVRLTGLRQELGHSPFYYESESSFGYFRHVWPDLETNSFYPFRPPAYAAMRGDTFHQVLVPMNLFGWLNVAPRVGGRFSYYGEANGPGATTSEETRAVFNTGVEVSFKASRLWRNTRSSFFDLDGLRHIVQPSVNYAYVPRPHPHPRRLPQFDYERPTYWLLPIDYPDYNAIDAIDSQNVMRFGLRNRLQTKREDGIENVVDWMLWTDWRLRPRTNQTTFSHLYSDLEIRPRSWFTLSSLARYHINGTKLQELDHILTLHPSSRWSFSVGHRYRDAFEFGPMDLGNNIILSSVGMRWNENWAFRASHHFEARDGHLEEQRYVIYRDMRSWTAALMVRMRDNRVGRDDYTIAVTFSLKAFPRFQLGEDTDRPSRLLGG